MPNETGVVCNRAPTNPILGLQVFNGTWELPLEEARRGRQVECVIILHIVGPRWGVTGDAQLRRTGCIVYTSPNIASLMANQQWGAGVRACHSACMSGWQRWLTSGLGFTRRAPGGFFGWPSSGQKLLYVTCARSPYLAAQNCQPQIKLKEH